MAIVASESNHPLDAARTFTVRDVEPRLDHLRALEAESIHILREVVAEFERPVMLYSIGKDSSVLVRLAQKAFYPGPIPFPLRDPKGQWDPKRQRPELWHLLNARVKPGESIRVFPLSNWTEIDVWQYIQ